VDKKTIRLSVAIDRDIDAVFAGGIPRGLKAEVIRRLVELFIETQQELGKDVFLVEALIKKRVKLSVQNLNIAKGRSAEEIDALVRAKT